MCGNLSNLVRRKQAIPRPLKIAHTLYVAGLVPVYWRHYGPGNFLWFSDLALIGLVPALWCENRRLISALALSVTLPEVPWNLGYFTRLFSLIVGPSGRVYTVWPQPYADEAAPDVQALKAAWTLRPTTRAQWTQLQALAQAARADCGLPEGR